MINNTSHNILNIHGGISEPTSVGWYEEKDQRDFRGTRVLIPNIRRRAQVIVFTWDGRAIIGYRKSGRQVIATRRDDAVECIQNKMRKIEGKTQKLLIFDWGDMYSGSSVFLIRRYLSGFTNSNQRDVLLLYRTPLSTAVKKYLNELENKYGGTVSLQKQQLPTIVNTFLKDKFDTVIIPERYQRWQLHQLASLGEPGIGGGCHTYTRDDSPSIRCSHGARNGKNSHRIPKYKEGSPNLHEYLSMNLGVRGNHVRTAGQFDFDTIKRSVDYFLGYPEIDLAEYFNGLPEV